MSKSQTDCGSILIIDDMPDSLRLVSRMLSDEGYGVHVAASGNLALQWLQRKTPDLILLDIKLPDIEGYEICARLKVEERLEHIPIIFISALNEQGDITKAFEAGGVDYVTKPFQAVEVLARVKTHINLRFAQQKLQSSYDEIKKLELQLEKENAYLRAEVKLNHPHAEIVGTSDAIRTTLRGVEEVATQNSTVLLLGETGTGKGLLASAIHRLSARSERLMINVNCAALTSTLIQAELFGAEKGAYTGSVSRQIGCFETADDSTLFLDEIGELPLELQSKLLRVLQDGEFERLGSNKTRKVNVRVVAASNRDLSKEVEEKRFREDLYYRLNVFPIDVPALRERTEDIPDLIWHFAHDIAKNMGKRIQSIPSRDMDKAQQHAWPGNIRELRNMVERSLILCDGPVLRLDVPNGETKTQWSQLTLDELQRRYIEETLQLTNWRIRGSNGAALRLGIKPTTLEARMKKMGIQRP